MMYVLVPNDSLAIRVFGSYAAMEQLAREEAVRRLERGVSPNWCHIIGYVDGLDEYTPYWLFTVTPTLDLHRQPIS